MFTVDYYFFIYSIYPVLVSKEPTKTTLGIFFTNCMSFINDSAGLFPTMARSNHSCTPNSEFISRPLLGIKILLL